jgi:NitT/TauT family transport system substrate-binding protein
MYPYDNPVGGINGAILTTESKIRSDAAALKQVVMAHRKASEELTADPDRWAKITSDNWGFNLETTRASLSNVALRWRLDQAFLAQYKAYMEQLKEVGFLDTVPDPTSFVHTEFMPA